MFKKSTSYLCLVIVIIGLSSFNVIASDPVSGQQPDLLTLEKCIALASENSKDLQLATKQVAAKKETLSQAKAGFWPTVRYGYLATNIDTGLVKTENSEASLSMEQTLYAGGRLTAGLKIAQLEYEKALEDQRNAKQQLNYGVKQSYYGIWLAEQKLKVTQASYDYMGRLYQQTKKFYDVGTKSKFELLSAQTDWEKRKPDLIEAQNGVIKAKLKLANLIGLPAERAFNVGDELSQFQLPEKPVLSLQTLLEEASQKNPEIRNAAKNLEIAKNSVKLATAGYKPTIAASAIKSNDMDDSSQTMTVTVNLSGVAFDGFKTQSLVTAAKENENASKIAESKTRDSIRLNVQEALLDLEASLEKARANQATSNLAKETLRMTQARYEAGMATTMDISEVQIKMDEALIGYYKGLSDYIIALANLDKTLGRDPQ